MAVLHPIVMCLSGTISKQTDGIHKSNLLYPTNTQVRLVSIQICANQPSPLGLTQFIQLAMPALSSQRSIQVIKQTNIFISIRFLSRHPTALPCTNCAGLLHHPTEVALAKDDWESWIDKLIRWINLHNQRDEKYFIDWVSVTKCTSARLPCKYFIQNFNCDTDEAVAFQW